MQPEDIDRWHETMANFMAGDEDVQLLHFDKAAGDLVNKGYWLKFNPHENEAKVARLNWLGEVVGDVVERSPKCSEQFEGKLWFVTCTVREFPVGCSYYDEDGFPAGCSYYDEDGDPFDPENGANWDGDQQVGFRD